MVAPARRRVSYVIPPPQSGSTPRLQLPPPGVTRRGSIFPLLIPLEPIAIPHSPSTRAFSHPKHRLPVVSLALDSITHLAGRPSPEGILYTGGRDGMVISWDLHLPTRQRPTRLPKPQRGRWEMLTGWGDDWYDGGEEDTENGPSVGTDGDVLGDVTASTRKRRKSSAASNEEGYWELDPAGFIPGQVNTPLLLYCSLEDTQSLFHIAFGIPTVRPTSLRLGKRHPFVQSGSDGSVVTPTSQPTPHPFPFKSYLPPQMGLSRPGTPTTHLPIPLWSAPIRTMSGVSHIGICSSNSTCTRLHSLCPFSPDQNWVASGSFDKSIKLWDLNRASSTSPDPLITLKSPDSTGSKSSVYAIAVDPAGSVIASGTPERVIRTWDPRSGKRTAKLVGHTDNIRAILISADGKYASRLRLYQRTSLISAISY